MKKTLQWLGPFYRIYRTEKMKYNELTTFCFCLPGMVEKRNFKIRHKNKYCTSKSDEKHISRSAIVKKLIHSIISLEIALKSASEVIWNPLVRVKTEADLQKQGWA